MALDLSRSVLLFGICCVLTLSFCITGDVEAQDVSALCEQALSSTAKELGYSGGSLSCGKDGCGYYNNGFQLMVFIFDSEDSANAYWNLPATQWRPGGLIQSRTPTKFHDYPARWQSALRDDLVATKGD